MDLTAVDESLEQLRDTKDRWARLPISDRIRYLEQIRDLLVENADAWVAAGVQMKGLDPDSPLVGGEEWLGGPYPTVAWLTDMIDTLTRLSTGADPLEGVRIRTRAEARWSRASSPRPPTTDCCSTATSSMSGCSPG